MNKIYHIFILLVFSFFSCKSEKQENGTDTFVDFEGKTHIQFIVSNCKDTTVFQIQSRTVIPWRLENKQLVIPKDGIYNLTVNSTHPFLDLLFCQNRKYPLFTIPNDTLNVYVDLCLLYTSDAADE